MATPNLRANQITNRQNTPSPPIRAPRPVPAGIIDRGNQYSLI